MIAGEEKEKDRGDERDKSNAASSVLPLSPPPRRHQRRRWVLVLGAVLFVSGGAAGIAWWFHRPGVAVPPLLGDIQDAEVRQALKRARQKVLDKPHSAAAWGNLGMTLEAHLYEAEADRCFTEAARLNPNEARWPYFRGLYALKTDPDHAVPFLRQAAARAAPEDQPVVRLRLAEALLEREQWDEAEQLFREESRRQPNQFESRIAFGLGLIAAARGEDQAAEKYLTVAQASPTARRAATARLAALARNRRDEVAAGRYDKEAAPRPGDALAWPDPLVEQIVRLRVGPDRRAEEVTQLVTRLERERRFDEAAQVYLQQLDKTPSVSNYVGAGLNLGRKGDYEQAMTLLRKAVALDPASSQAHSTLAMVQFRRAEKEWARSPGSPQAKEWFRDSIEHGQRAAQLKPDLARNYLHWGLALHYLRESAQAIEPLRKGVACRPTDSDLQYALGEVLLTTGQRQDAETYLENACKLDPNDKRPFEALQRLRRNKD